MKVLHKFIIKSYLGPMFLTFFIVLFVFLIQFLWVYIDEMVGKGLSWSILLEFMGWMSLTFIPMALPLSTLFASIMTLGNLGENNELLALKAAGISLRRILNPLIVVIIFVAIGGFFGSNNLIPFANFKARALLYDIKKKRPELTIPEGIFYSGMPGYSIRINKKDPVTQLLVGVTIYDHKNDKGNVSITMADSGYIKQTPDQKYMLLTLYNGNTYEDDLTNAGSFKPGKNFKRHSFSEQTLMISLGNLDFERTEDDRFKENALSQNIIQLGQSYDSLSQIRNSKNQNFHHQLTQTTYIFNHTNEFDTTAIVKQRFVYDAPFDSTYNKLTAKEKENIAKSAKQKAENSIAQIDAHFYENEILRKKVTNLQIEWHRKFTLSIACILFFFIGAPLGAIIRKGGLGTPVVVSVFFFIIYYVIDITSKKLGQSGSWNPIVSAWVSTAALAPIGAFLTYKSSTDSALFNVEQYGKFFNKILGRVSKLIQRIDLDSYPTLKNIESDTSLIDLIGKITLECAQFSKEYELDKFFIFNPQKWLLQGSDQKLNAINEQYNHLVENLANIYDERIRENVKQYPIFNSENFKLHQYNLFVRILLLIVFPVGFVVNTIELNKRKKLYYILKEIISINNNIELTLKRRNG